MMMKNENHVSSKHQNGYYTLKLMITLDFIPIQDTTNVKNMYLHRDSHLMAKTLLIQIIKGGKLKTIPLNLVL